MRYTAGIELATRNAATPWSSIGVKKRDLKTYNSSDFYQTYYSADLTLDRAALTTETKNRANTSFARLV
jgi:hypothetical protein